MILFFFVDNFWIRIGIKFVFIMFLVLGGVLEIIFIVWWEFFLVMFFLLLNNFVIGGMMLLFKKVFFLIVWFVKIKNMK